MTNSKVQNIDLASYGQNSQKLSFTRAETPEKNSPLVTVYYALNGIEQNYGLRLDVSKRAFLDVTGDSDVDSSLRLHANRIVDFITNYAELVFGPVSSDVSLIKPYSQDGDFWLPGNRSSARHGSFVFEPFKSLKIKVSGTLSSETGASFSGARYPVVLVRFTDGTIATFLDVLVTSRSMTMHGDGACELVADRCVFGVHAASPDVLEFESCTVRFNSLKEWMSPGGVKFDDEVIDKDRYKLSFTYTSEPPTNINIDSDDLELVLWSGPSWNHSRDGDFTISLHAGITLNSGSAKPFDVWLDNPLRKLKQLFSTLDGYPVHFLQLTFTPEKETGRDNCPVLFVQNERKSPAIPRYAERMLLPHADVKDSLGNITNSWFASDPSVFDSVDRYFSVVGRFDIPFELQFIALLSAIEILCSNLVDNQSVRRGRGRIGLTGLVESVASIFEASTIDSVFGNSKSALREAIALRNRILHGPHEANSDFGRFRALYAALRSFYFAILLKQLGVSEALIVKRLQRSIPFSMLGI